jgi:hypothetical protein
VVVRLKMGCTFCLTESEQLRFVRYYLLLTGVSRSRSGLAGSGFGVTRHSDIIHKPDNC